MDGTDASNFAHTETLPFPVLYRGAVTEAVALPEPPGPWHGRRVSIRKLLPDVADRQKVADFLNKSHAIAQEMWRYCVKLRTDPAAKPPRKVTAEPTVIPASAIPARYRDWQWDCTNPESCVPMETRHTFESGFSCSRARPLFEKHGIEDRQLLQLMEEGVRGLVETRPYAIVLNFNYASLA